MKKAAGFFRDSPLPGWVLVLSALFLFRLAFGLCSDIWFVDQLQIYLIGLKYYATDAWPYFGPDVAAQIQLPGALQGLAVGLPLKLCPQPEAPYVLLNLLSFAGLSLFAWYCCKRLPSFPKGMIWVWLMTAPWALNWSTNIDNDSYALFGSLVFFTGFLESLPGLTLKVIPPGLAGFMMGLGLFWCAQFHMSWVILLPFVFTSFLLRASSGWKNLSPSVPFFVLGCLITGGFILPTLFQYGLSQGSGGIGGAVAFNPENLAQLPVVLARFLSLAACEIPRFLGAHTADRLAFLGHNPWLAPWAVAAALLGIVQTVLLALFWFQKKHPQAEWPAVKRLFLWTFVLIYASFLFSIKAPAAHTYYIALPIAMLYGFYCFSPWISKPLFLNTAKVLLVCNIVFHAGLAVHNFQTKSLYKDRGLFVKAIQERNYHLLGERRPGTLY